MPATARRRAVAPGGAAAPAGLRWSYSFDTTGWLDDTANGNNLTSFGSPTNPAGKISNCIATNGGPDGAYHVYNAAYDLSGGTTPGDGWISGFLNVHSKVDNCWFLSMNSAGTQSYYVAMLASSSKLQCGYVDGGGTGRFVRADTFGALSLDTWYFFSLVFKAATNLATLTINNDTAKADTATATSGIGNPNTINRFGIGANWGGTTFDSGNNSLKVDNLNGWNFAPSSGQETAMYNAGAGVPYPFTGVA